MESGMTSEALIALARRVEANVPSHTQPERFHEEKSEIVVELKRLAREEKN